VSAVNAPPIAVIRGYRRPGHAIVTVERQGRPAHRHKVCLRRYQALRRWLSLHERAPTSGVWMRSGFSVSLWPERAKEVKPD
jgi:hypothetical protein